MQAVFINECKSCKTSNQIFFNVMFSFSKTKDKLLPNRINQGMVYTNKYY